MKPKINLGFIYYLFKLYKYKIRICMKFLKTNEKFGNKCYNINQWKQN